MKKGADQSLTALFDLEAEGPDTIAAQRLPTLNERVEILLRAIHAGERQFSAYERAAARSRILDAMASDLSADELVIRNDVYSAAAVVEGLAGAPARRRVPPHKIKNLAEVLRDALLFPFILIAAGGPMRFATASVAAILVACAAWSGAWLYGARTAETTIASWIAREAQSGRSYDCTSSSLGGFPYRLELRCTEPTAKIAYDQSTYTASAKELHAFASVLRPDSLKVEITGPLSVSQGNQPVLLANWKIGEFTLNGTAAEVTRSSALIDGAQFYRVTQTSMEPLLTSERFEMQIRRRKTSPGSEVAFEIGTHVTGGSVPSIDTLAGQSFTADVTAILHDVENPTPKALPERLREWRAGGGRLEVKSARVQQGDAIATAQGGFSLADNGRIEGVLRVATAGHYVQLAQSLFRNATSDEAERARIAQSFLSGPQVRSRSLGNVQGNEPETRSGLESDARRAEMAARQRVEQERQQSIESRRTNEQNRDRAPSSARINVQPSTRPELSIRFVDGNMYVGPALVGKVPPLF